MTASVLFTLCAAMAVGGAFGAALIRNLFHAALLLGLCLFGCAGLYLLLEQTWLACVQVVVYIGGILVLVLFATLFSADVMGTVQRRGVLQVTIGSLAALLCGAVAARLAAGALTRTGERRALPGMVDPLAGEAGSVSIGDLLTGEWFVPFLAAGVLLTAALVGSVATVQRFRRPATAVRGG